MKAIVCTKYGPPEVLQLKEVTKPGPNDDQTLVQVHAASVTFSNLLLVTGGPFPIRLIAGWFRKPKVQILGSDIAGRIEAVGRNVERFQPGDEVFGYLADCGKGGYAEYVCAPEKALGLKPANLSFEEAAAVPEAALVALQAVRDDGQIQKGQKVLIYGASGGIGTFAVQIAKSFGAEVTGVCSTRNVDLVRAIGADHVIDYTQEDCARGDGQYDLIFQLAGTHSPSALRRALTPKGTLVLSSGMGRIGGLDRIVKVLVSALFVSQSMRTWVADENKKDLVVLKELLESGKVTPVIDRSYGLSEAPEAIRYVEEGHTQGKVIISLSSPA